jgi:hypothetical protein
LRSWRRCSSCCWTTMLSRRLLREAIAEAIGLRGRWSRADRTPGR